MAFTPERVAIEKLNGRVVSERPEPYLTTPKAQRSPISSWSRSTSATSALSRPRNCAAGSSA